LLDGRYCYVNQRGLLNIVVDELHTSSGPTFKSNQGSGVTERSKLCKVGNNPVGIPTCSFSGQSGSLYVSNDQFFSRLGKSLSDSSVWLKLSASETGPIEIQSSNCSDGDLCAYKVKVWSGTSSGSYAGYRAECWHDGYIWGLGWINNGRPDYCRICYVP
jgi:hypothetical protein